MKKKSFYSPILLLAVFLFISAVSPDSLRAQTRTFVAEYMHDFTRTDNDSTLKVASIKGLKAKIRKNVKPFIDSLINSDDSLKVLYGQFTAKDSFQQAKSDSATAPVHLPEITTDIEFFSGLWENIPDPEIVETKWISDQYFAQGKLELAYEEIRNIISSYTGERLERFSVITDSSLVADSLAIHDSLASTTPDSLLTEKPPTPQELFDEGVKLYEEGKYELARNIFSKITKLDSVSSDVHLYKALTFYGEAVEQNKKLNEKYPERYSLHGFKEALIRIQEAIDMDSTLAENEMLSKPYFNMAEVFYKSGNINDTYYIYQYIDEAKTIMRKAAQLGYKKAIDWLNVVENKQFDNNPYFLPDYGFKREKITAPISKSELFGMGNKDED